MEPSPREPGPDEAEVVRAEGQPDLVRQGRSPRPPVLLREATPASLAGLGAAEVEGLPVRRQADLVTQGQSETVIAVPRRQAALTTPSQC